jgi:hypothetical protein
MYNSLEVLLNLIGKWQGTFSVIKWKKHKKSYDQVNENWCNSLITSTYTLIHISKKFNSWQHIYLLSFNIYYMQWRYKYNTTKHI